MAAADAMGPELTFRSPRPLGPEETARLALIADMGTNDAPAFWWCPGTLKRALVADPPYRKPPPTVNLCPNDAPAFWWCPGTFKRTLVADLYCWASTLDLYFPLLATATS
eukprot:9478241-Pyramimonas_sp.AAC.3